MNVPASPPARDHILCSILAILFSVACFSVLNAISKTLTQHYPVVQVIWARYVFAFVFMMALFLPRSGLALFRWHNVGSQVVRGLLLFFSSFLYFHGIVYLPLATAASISLTSPLIVTALSARFLGEPVGVRRWIAVWNDVSQQGTGALEFVVKQRILIRCQVQPGSMVHNAHTDVADKLVGQQGVAIVHDAVQNGGQAGEPKFKGNQPPKIAPERRGMREMRNDRIDNQLRHGQQSQGRQSGDAAKD